jgi:RHS repeat-associated protein
MSNNVPQRKIDENTDWQGVDWSVTGVNGAQQPTITIRYLNGGGGSDVRTWQEFSYDNGMRMTDQKYLYALNGAGLSAPTFTLSNQVYNYKDQLIEKNIGYRGTNNALQSIDYQYNTRGWLTGINTVNVYGGQSILTPSGMGSGGISGLAVTPFLGEALSQGMSTEQNVQGKALLMPPVADNNIDLFSQVLTYGSPDSRTGAAPQSNGNISSTTWHVAGRAKQAYGFAYDDLNRLTDATYFDVTDSYSGSWNSNFSADNKFNEQLTYDLRGNIITLQRNGLNSNGWTGNNFVAGTYGRIDNLTYAYNTKNQLLSVNEASLPTRGFKTNPNATGNQYGYDGNGNLIYDKNKNITSIEYNYLNLPIKVVIDNPADAVNSGSIEFVYDATGVKLRKTVKNKDGSVKETWDYVNGVEYKNQILQRVAHSEGAVVRNDFGQYQHEYVLRDHLGNTRVTFTDGVNKGEPYWDWSNYSYIAPDNTGYDDGVVTEADIKHINHTYPFGMAMEGNWNNAGSANNNRYLYNGKQWNDDFGMGWYDYGARFYDPSVARWGAIDPMAEARITLSGYQYVQNNPVKLIDPTGMLDAKSMYGGTYGYDSQQAAKKSVSDRMDDADDKQFNEIGARKVIDLEGNSHTLTEDDIQGSYSVAGVWKTTATAGTYSTTTYDIAFKKNYGPDDPPKLTLSGYTKSVSFGVACFGGFGFEFGKVYDKHDGSRWFLRGDVRVGFGTEFSYGTSQIYTKPNKSFVTSDYAGYDINISTQLGLFGWTRGGNTPSWGRQPAKPFGLAESYGSQYVTSGNSLEPVSILQSIASRAFKIGPIGIGYFRSYGRTILF